MHFPSPLFQHLMSLDNCLSYGSMEIKNRRKKLVVRIHKIMKQADKLSAAWLERTKLFEDLKPQPMIPVATCDATADFLIPQVPTANDDEPDDYQPENTGLEPVIEASGDRQSYLDTDESEGPNGRPIDIAGESDSDSSAETPPSPPAMRRNASTTTDQHVPSSCTTHRVRRTDVLPQWHPQADIFDDNTHIIVAAEVPGMKFNDFDLRIADGHLLILGEKPGSIREQFAYRRGEPPAFGTLNLKIRLPPNIHLQGDASYEDGILQVRFPKQRRRRMRPQRNFWDPFGAGRGVFSLL